jgi:hypothetical protein
MATLTVRTVNVRAVVTLSDGRTYTLEPGQTFEVGVALGAHPPTVMGTSTQGRTHGGPRVQTVAERYGMTEEQWDDSPIGRPFHDDEPEEEDGPLSGPLIKMFRD